MHGAVRPGIARQRKANQGKDFLSVCGALQGIALRGEAGNGEVLSGEARRGLARLSMARQGKARQGFFVGLNGCARQGGAWSG